MSRYRARRDKPRRPPCDAWSSGATLNELIRGAVVVIGFDRGFPPIEHTHNYRALNRPLLLGAKTPLQWPPVAWSRAIGTGDVGRVLSRALR